MRYGGLQLGDGLILEQIRVEVQCLVLDLPASILRLILTLEQVDFLLLLFLEFLRDGVALLPGEDILRHGDPKLIRPFLQLHLILHFLHLKFLLLVQLVHPLQLLLVLPLDHLLVLSPDQVEGQLALVDVAEVDEVDDHHGEADDERGQGVVE